MISERLGRLSAELENQNPACREDFFIAQKGFLNYTNFEIICNFSHISSVIIDRETGMQLDNSYALLSDEELLIKAKANDTPAFNQLHQRYRGRILNYVYRLLGRYEVAEEITQETFIRVYTNLANSRVENVSAWIYTIARNLALNELRKRKYQPQLSLDEPISEEETKAERMEFLSNGSESAARQKELENRIWETINALVPKYREVMILCGLQGLSYVEAARILNCSVQNVAIRIYRARKMMRKIFFGERGEIR